MRFPACLHARRLLQERTELDRLDALLALAAGEIEVAVDDTRHLLDVGAQIVEVARRRATLASISSSSFIRVSGVRRSCETAASISVRWPMWRRMRLRIRLKAAPARRISVGPASRKSPDVAALAELVHRPGEPQDRAHLAGHEVRAAAAATARTSSR